MHPRVHRRPARPGRIIELVVAPAIVEVEPSPLAEVLPFPRKSWKERNLMPEVLQAFRDAKHGDT